MILLYMDESVDRRITLGLRRKGVDILTVEDENLKGTPDPVLLDHAHSLGRAMFTMDDDFLADAARRQKVGIDFSGVIYVKQLTLGIGQCIDELAVVALTGQPEDIANQVIYLPITRRQGRDG